MPTIEAGPESWPTWLQKIYRDEPGLIERRGAKRFLARWDAACLAWPRGDTYEGCSAELVDIGLGGALLLMPHPPTIGSQVLFCLDGLETPHWIVAEVMDIQHARENGEHPVRIGFPEPCPEQILAVAIRGTCPAA